MVKPSQPLFAADEVERAHRYHRPLYAALALDLVLGFGVLGLLAFSRVGVALDELVDGLAWWLETLAFTALVVTVVTLVRLPVSFWRGYLHEHRFGLSTQTRRGWLADRAKAAGVGLVLTALTMLGLLGLARRFPEWWPVAAAAGGAALVLLLSFVAPVVLEPLFNRFRPLQDEQLAADLLALAERAGVPVERVLVADASRRTHKANAYVSGLGRTRRVVLFDTLLSSSAEPEVRLVVAHELAHRRKRHVAKGTALAMGGTAVGVAAIWLVLRWDAVLGSVGASGPGDPQIVPLVLLLAGLLELTTAPFFTALSRRWERDADRGSLELTRDAEAFESAHRRLALTNLADLDPPRALYVLLFTHPTPPERIAAARRWAAAAVGLRTA